MGIACGDEPEMSDFSWAVSALNGLKTHAEK